MVRRFGALLALALVFATSTATRAEDANRECDNDRDVTIVVDFGSLGGGVNVRCAPQPIENGFDVFKNANISYEVVPKSGFVCRIAGKPENADCTRTAPGDAYWAYWWARPGEEWRYSNYGPAYRKPPAGSYDGWVFKTGESNPPRYPVRAAPTTTPPTTAVTGGGGGSGGGPAPQPPSPGPTTSRVRGSAGSATTTTHTDAATTSSLPEVLYVAPSESAAETTIPYGNVDLTVDHGDGGTSTGFIFSAIGVAGVAALAFAFLRLRGR